ncbi:alpha/beta hydrolase [Limnoglobus roseus]|uniref:Alpha/beta hydrolase n=1 Tax=Limnoglobus roseus TaxID=2598579 RepID=A0A5C1ALG9_9BACT|nr:alpha/beta fold hydrolase [Limnoglobus roseus]QEL17748.1 alpha/beta hydrolase [Limnoglobus roseus]
MRTNTFSAAVLVLLTVGANASAADARRVAIRTADGVELVGRYQPGPLGNKSPGVLILDGIGDGRRPKTCDAVAAALHKQGCATLCFDFRGHGASTVVTEDFWDDPTNRRLVRGYTGKTVPEEVDWQDFRPGYRRALVNDVAAARAFLDRRNDTGECNSGQLFVVGFGEGASVGALWAATEWSRHRVTGGLVTRLAPTPEGRDVRGCVWVEPATALDRRPVPLLDCLKRATAKGGTYVGLIRADQDEAQEKLADQLQALNRKETTFRGVALPTKNLLDDAALPARVAAMIDKMRDVNDPPPWDDRDFSDKRYAWALPGGGTILAKEEDAQNLRPIPLDRLVGR